MPIPTEAEVQTVLDQVRTYMAATPNALDGMDAVLDLGQHGRHLLTGGSFTRLAGSNPPGLDLVLEVDPDALLELGRNAGAALGLWKAGKIRFPRLKVGKAIRFGKMVRAAVEADRG